MPDSFITGFSELRATMRTATQKDRRVRVLQLGNPTGMYGAERGILALVRHLPQSRIESWVAVIKDAPHLDAPLCAEAARLGLQTQIFESYGRLSLSSISQLTQFIREHRIDVLHTHGYKTDILGCLAARKARCKIVATPHGWGATPGVKVKLYEMLDRGAFLFCDAVVPLSSELHEGLSRLPGLRRRLHLIRNGIDLDDLDDLIEPEPELEALKRAGISVVGYVGRLDAGKCVDTLIRAFHLLARPNTRLWIVGDGPHKEALIGLAAALSESDRIVFTGFRTDRLALLRMFDVFVLPSEHEGIPRCLMEAMGCGIPVIASDIPGCRDLVSESAGLLFRPRDAEGLASKIKALLDDPSHRAQLAANGRRRIQAGFLAQTMAANYSELYERLTSSIVPPAVCGGST